MRARTLPHLTLVVALLAGLVLALPGVSARADVPTDRLSGGDRFGTAVAISQAQFPDEAASVYLARATAPLVDALAGGALTDGPILLVPSCGAVPQAVLDEVVRLDPDRVVALGGPQAVCDQVLTDAAQGRATARLAADSRFGTAAAIAVDQFPDGATTAYLARATDPLVDALAGGVLTDGPVLLVPSCGPVPQVVLDAVETLDPDRVVALGGPTAICDQVLADTAQGRATDRLAGDDRFATAVEISQAQFPGGATTVYLARAVDPLVDALAGGVLTDGPILLVPACGDVPAAVTAEIERLNPDRVVALGGEQAICQDLLEQAGADAPDPSGDPTDDPTDEPTDDPTDEPTEPTPTETETEPTTDLHRPALTAFHEALDGPGWTNDTGWLTEAPTCDWFGITCEGGALTAIQLTDNGLAGDVPAELADITTLVKLAIAGNDITSLPEQISALDALQELGLRANALTALPDGVGGLASLDRMNLRDNQLTGDVSGWVRGLAEADTVTFLRIDDGLGGNDCLTVSDPDAAAMAAWLDGLAPDWDRCDVSDAERDALLALYDATDGPAWTDRTGWEDRDGDHCSWFGIACDDDGRVTVVGLYLNGLAGPVPADVGVLTRLEYFDVFDNAVTSVPDELGQLTRLQEVYLSFNPIPSVPPAVAALPDLQALFVNDISLTGDITELATNALANSTLGGFSLVDWGVGGNDCLTVSDPTVRDQLDAAHPYWSGCVATETAALDALYAATSGDNWTSASGWTDPGVPHCQREFVVCNRDTVAGLEFPFGGNNVVGALPEELGDLHWLDLLQMSDNEISGLPASIGDLDQLLDVRLGNNSLTSLPDEIGDLELVQKIDLADNELTSLPASVGQLATLEELLLRFNQLVGQDLSPWVAGLHQAQALTRFELADNDVVEGQVFNECNTVGGDATLAAWLDGFDPNWDECSV